jgi:hypothetical protein
VRAPLCAVEGSLDEAVIRRVAGDLDFPLGTVRVKGGRGRIEARVRGYHAASRHWPWIVVADLDTDQCPPTLLQTWQVPSADDNFICRIAVREIEAWLLADRLKMAAFIKVSRDLIPGTPDQLPDPKETIVNLARRSRSRDLREDIVPDPGSLRREGPAYTSRLSEFANTLWRPREAQKTSSSFDRFVKAMELMRKRTRCSP